jgi:hypothetical protein
MPARRKCLQLATRERLRGLGTYHSCTPRNQVLIITSRNVNLYGMHHPWFLKAVELVAAARAYCADPEEAQRSYERMMHRAR